MVEKLFIFVVVFIIVFIRNKLIDTVFCNVFVYPGDQLIFLKTKSKLKSYRFIFVLIHHRSDWGTPLYRRFATHTPPMTRTATTTTATTERERQIKSIDMGSRDLTLPPTMGPTTFQLILGPGFPPLPYPLWLPPGLYPLPPCP